MVNVVDSSCYINLPFAKPSVKAEKAACGCVFAMEANCSSSSDKFLTFALSS